MPTMSSSRVKPPLTPCTALAASARVRPCSAACSSLSRFTSSLPCPCSIEMPAGIGTLRVPFGPVTWSCSPIVTFTPLGSGIGLLPILDIVRSQPFSARGLPDPAENLSAEMLLMRVAPGHHAAGRGQDVDSETAQYARNIAHSHVHPAAGARDALDRRDHRRVAVTVLQVDLNGFLCALFGHLEVGDVA